MQSTPQSQSSSNNPADKYSEASEDGESKKPQRKTPKPPKKISERYLYNSGLHYLNRYAASQHQFETVMRRKITRSLKHHKNMETSEAEKLLQGTIKKFQDLGFINDTAFAIGYMNSLHKRGFSKAKIRAKFAAKGLSAELFDKAIDENNIGSDEFWAALRYLQRKRKGPFRIKDGDETTLQKEMAALARQGFSYDVVKKALDLDEESALDILNKRD